MSKPFIKWEDDDGIDRNLPARYVVCDDCEGHGTTLNENIRQHAYSAEEFYEAFDEEEAEEYFKRGGRYDVPCKTCGGARVVLEVDEAECEPALLAAYRKCQEEKAQADAEWAHERRMERYMLGNATRRLTMNEREADIEFTVVEGPFHTISEARLNDMCYMVLKNMFFGPALGTNPREADIRVCMDMAVPERITMASAILMPDEVSGRSHDVFYNVDVGRVFDEAIEYLADHWRVEMPNEEQMAENRKHWLEVMVPILLDVPEAQCGGED